MFIFIFGLFTILGSITTIYGLISHKTFSRPIIFISLGLLTCILSTLTYMSFDAITKIIGDEKYRLEYDMLKQILSLSLASLGGSLISSGFTTKATIEHVAEESRLKDQLLDLLKHNAELHDLYLKKQELGDKDGESACIKLMIENKNNIDEIEEELKIKGRVNAANK